MTYLPVCTVKNWPTPSKVPVTVVQPTRRSGDSRDPFMSSSAKKDGYTLFMLR